MLSSQKTVGNWLYSVLPAVLYRADICSWQDADSDPASAPVGLMGKSLLAIGGAHCRLSNISADGKWLKDEVFWVGGERKVHLKGNSVGNLMLEWRKLKFDSKLKMTAVLQPTDTDFHFRSC